MKAITILGNLGKDPKKTTTQTGKEVTSFSLAVQDGFGDNKRTLWFDVSVWGNRGNVIANNVKKGDKLCVTGDLSTREYEGKTYLTVNASDFSFAGGSQGQSSGGHDAPPVGNDMGSEIPF